MKELLMLALCLDDFSRPLLEAIASDVPGSFAIVVEKNVDNIMPEHPEEEDVTKLKEIVIASLRNQVKETL
ncbi:MAG: hypothetical protein WKF88_09275 [Ferruginibacter sp.]